MKTIRANKRKKTVYRIGQNRKTLLKEVAPGWLPKLKVHPKSSEIILSYPNKSDANYLIENIPGSKLVEVESFGQMGFDSIPNLLIQGENTTVLKNLLQDKFIAGKVNQIYIDPPFSTRQEFRIGKERTATISASNGDALAYTDTLTGSRFIEFLRSRLILLRELLSDNGSIYLHIDCKVGHYVKILMDEVFGPENFVNDITRIKCNPKNL